MSPRERRLYPSERRRAIARADNHIRRAMRTLVEVRNDLPAGTERTLLTDVVAQMAAAEARLR